MVSVKVETPPVTTVPLTTTQSSSNSSGSQPNGNSKKSTKPQHNYDVKNTKNNKVVKTGTSGGKVTKSGQSYRGNAQAKKWSKAEKKPGKYKSTITNQVKGGKGARQKALEYEAKRANKLRKQLDPKKHRRP